MKFHVNRDVFSEAVSFVVKLLPQRNPQPILAGVLIEASEAGLSLSAFDYEASARTTIDATVDEPGTILVHGRLLSEIASRLPNAPVQVVVQEDGGILLSCGSARFTLSAMPVHEYPAIPEVTGESGVVPGDDFATAIAQVAFAASRDDVTPVLTGVQLEVTDNQLSLVATDRYRVALRDIPWDGETTGETTAALVPARTLQEVGKTFGGGGNILMPHSTCLKCAQSLHSFTAPLPGVQGRATCALQPQSDRPRRSGSAPRNRCCLPPKTLRARSSSSRLYARTSSDPAGPKRFRAEAPRARTAARKPSCCLPRRR